MNDCYGNLVGVVCGGGVVIDGMNVYFCGGYVVGCFDVYGNVVGWVGYYECYNGRIINSC